MLGKGDASAVASVDPDLALLQAAITRAQELSSAYNDLVPLNAIREGFWFRGQRISFGSFYRGIYRARQMHGRAALSLVTKPPKVGRSTTTAPEAPTSRTTRLFKQRTTFRLRSSTSAGLLQVNT